MVNTISLQTVICKSDGIEYPIDLADIPQNAVNKVFEYGLRRWLNDHVNSEKAKDLKAFEEDGETPRNVKDIALARIANLKAGIVSSGGGGGGKLPIATRALRTVVRNWLVNSVGMKMAEVRKLVKDETTAKKAIGDWLATAIATADGITVNEVDDAKLAATLAKVWDERIVPAIATETVKILEQEEADRETAVKVSQDVLDLIKEII